MVKDRHRQDRADQAPTARDHLERELLFCLAELVPDRDPRETLNLLRKALVEVHRAHTRALH